MRDGEEGGVGEERGREGISFALRAADSAAANLNDHQHHTEESEAALIQRQLPLHLHSLVLHGRPLRCILSALRFAAVSREHATRQ